MIGIILIIALFIGLGLYLLTGRGAFLIAGYNSMSEEERAQYDEKALAKFMGKMILALSFSMGFWALSIGLAKDWLFYVGLVLFMLTILFMMIYMNTNQRFKKKHEENHF